MLPGGSRAKLVHLEDWNPGLFNECVHLLCVGCVCTIFLLHHHNFFAVSIFTPVASSSVVRTEPVFPHRHPAFSVVLVCLSRFVSEVGSQVFCLLKRREMVPSHDIPSTLHAEDSLQIFGLSSTDTLCSTERPHGCQSSRRAYEVVWSDPQPVLPT